MDIDIEPKFAAFLSKIWQPGRLQLDKAVRSPKVSTDGLLVGGSLPLEGPEVDAERYFTLIWNSARPSRWLQPRDFVCLASVTESGKLRGDIGYNFTFVDSIELADGRHTFAVGWGME